MDDRTCPKCGKVMCDKRSLDRHLRRKIPCDHKYECPKCCKEFKNNRDLNLHMKRKTPCSKYVCEYCNRGFAVELEYYKHLVDCKVNALRIGNMTTNIGVQNQTINVHVENNQQINLVCVFGQEKTDHIDAAKVVKMLENNIGQFLPKMVQYVHADPNAPGNSNIIFNPEENKFYMMGQPNVWKKEDPDETMVQLRDNIQRHIQLMQPRILPHITIESKENCESLLMGRKEYREMTAETVDQTKKVLEDSARIEKIKAITV